MIDIQERLEDIEADKSIRILLAVLCGSREWGYSTDKSDYDVYFVYTRGERWYMQLNADWNDVIERRFIQRDSPLVEAMGWNLAKALRLMHKGSPHMHELLQSKTTYIADENFRVDLERQAQQYFNPRAAFHHYLAMAAGNFRRYILSREDGVIPNKKYLVILRSLLLALYIYEKNEVPPMDIHTLAAFGAETMPADAHAAFLSLMASREDSAAPTSNAGGIPVLTSFMNDVISTLNDVRSESLPTGQANNWAPINNLFRRYAPALL